MIRGAVVSLVYNHTLTLDKASTASKTPYTLINADIDRIQMGLRNMHELWASAIEIGLSLWLLEMRLGVSTVAVVFVIIGELS